MLAWTTLAYCCVITQQVVAAVALAVGVVVKVVVLVIVIAWQATPLQKWTAACPIWLVACTLVHGRPKAKVGRCMSTPA